MTTIGPAPFLYTATPLDVSHKHHVWLYIRGHPCQHLPVNPVKLTPLPTMLSALVTEPLIS